MSDAQLWHEDDDFWSAMAPSFFTEERRAVAPAEIDLVLGHLNVEPAAAILDLCCGPGRHSLELARRGFRVTGVDRTRGYLQKAREQAQAAGLDIEFVHADMREFCRPEAFDGAINLFTSFGYFEDPADDRRVLANVHRSLRPGATLIMDMMGKEILARIFRERDWEERDGGLLLQERKVDREWTWIENRWILVEDGARREYRVSHRIYSAAELCGLLRESGFASADAYGDLASAPYDHTARRLVVVARK